MRNSTLLLDIKFFLGNTIYKNKKLILFCLLAFGAGVLVGLLAGASLAVKKWLFCFLVDWLIDCLTCGLFAGIFFRLFGFFVFTLAVFFCLSIFKAGTIAVFVALFISGWIMPVAIHTAFIICGGFTAFVLTIVILIIFAFLLCLMIMAVIAAFERWECMSGYFATLANISQLIKLYLILTCLSLIFCFCISFVISLVIRI